MKSKFEAINKTTRISGIRTENPPSDFLRNKKISAEAKGTASFLQDLPKNWKIHPLWIQDQLGYGKKVWMRVAKELIEYGCLKYFKGGKESGSHYSFGFYEDAHKDLENYPTESRSLFTGLPKSDRHFSEPHIITNNNYINNNITTNNTDIGVSKTKGPEVDKGLLSKKSTHEIKQPPRYVAREDVVVNFENDILNKLYDYGVNKQTIMLWERAYGIGKINEKLHYLDTILKTGKEIANRAGWVFSALRDDYKMPTPKAPPRKYATHEETKLQFMQFDKIERSNIVTVNQNMRNIKQILGNIGNA